MKRLLSVLLCMALLLSCNALPAYAGTGEGNIDNGGGNMGSGTAKNIWHTGEEGVRITVVRATNNTPVTTPIDLTNKDESDIQIHFGKKSKLHYRNGDALTSSQSAYNYSIPSTPLPKIISDGGGNTNIEAIREYFCSEGTIKQLASLVGITYDKLTSREYKLLLEPIAYFTFEGFKVAMTATEAALYDQKLSGGLRRRMVSLSHQNLPLSMFLQHPDMGYPAYSGPTNKPQSDATIINELGLGIVKFTEDGDSDSTSPSDSTATYRVDTDVITSVTLSSDDEISPDHPAKVTFYIDGGSYTMTNIVIPEGESQLVWCKWHTPKTPQTVDIRVSATKGELSRTHIKAEIISMDGHEPPDPTASDRNDDFTIPDLPNLPQISTRTWGVWSGHWVPHWVWHEDWDWVSDPDSPTGGHWEDNGEWVDEGHWEYTFHSYRATLSASMSLMPSSRAWSAKGKEMKSGYGVEINVTSTVGSRAPDSHVTAAQTAVTYFPEFEYATYWRILDPFVDELDTVFHFKHNKYSTYNDRVHFTPLWYPDGTYTVYTYVADAWTPAGMLSLGMDDSVTIKGNVYDDWHIGPMLVD
jgi:hypothetical protein